MLVLSRKIGEKIVIGDNITIVVNRVSGNRISLGIEAPADVRIVRGELARNESASDAGETQHEAKAALVTPAVGLPTFAFLTTGAVHRAR